ncbi:hypothetical protein EJB05_35934, partial [Eragrostis curvula]
MLLPFRRSLAAAAAPAWARLRRGLATGASRPPWAMIHQAALVNSPAVRSTLLLADPPCTSHLAVPAHLVNPRLHPDSASVPIGVLGGMVRATSGDGLLLLQFVDGTAAAPTAAEELRAAPAGESMRFNIDPDITRFVCNPITGELFRLPDIDGTKKVPTWHPHGLLTRSERGHGPPDRYAVAELAVDNDAEEQSFVMRRFLSGTGEWEKLVGLPSPVPLPLLMSFDHEVVAFAGRLYWVNLTWGAISVDPFSDRPELRFLELPEGCAWPVPSADRMSAQSMCRRMGVSQGKLCFAELSGDDPYLLNMFVLNDEGSSWKLERRVQFSPPGESEVKPRIGVVEPLNESVTLILGGSHAISVDMVTGNVLDYSQIDEVEVGVPGSFHFSAFLKAVVLPPWLEAFRIPSPGD